MYINCTWQEQTEELSGCLFRSLLKKKHMNGYLAFFIPDSDSYCTAGKHSSKSYVALAEH